MLQHKESLKISNDQSEAVNRSQSEAVNRRMTDNTMTKKTWANRRTIIYKTLHKTLKIEQHELTKNRRRTRVIR
jgi:hypothetical protein